MQTPDASLRSFLSVLLLLASSRAQAQAVAPAPRSVVELAFLDAPGSPEARETVALRIDSRGGLWLPGGAAADLRSAGQMPLEEVGELLHELVQQHRLAAIDSAQLRQGIEQACRTAGLTPHVDGAAVTIIRFETEAGPREVRIEALSVMAARFPDFPEVQRLLTAQLRLQNVAAVAQAGGPQAADRLAQAANQVFRQSHPAHPPLTVRDLAMVRQLDTGSRYVQFYRRPGRGSQELLVSMSEIPGQPPSVSVTEIPAPLAAERMM